MNSKKFVFKHEKYDLDGDGKLSFEEFVRYINDTMNELSDEQKEKLKTIFPESLHIEAFFNSIGINLTATELDEIRTEHVKNQAVCGKLEYNFDSMCKVLFNFTDKDRNGFISASEMQFLLGKILGENIMVNLEAAIALIESVDENNDGMLDYREFISMFVRLAEFKGSS